MVHTCVGMQPGQVPPPQSTSVSAPLRTPSVQLTVRQTLATQLLVEQSAGALHALPVVHGVHEPPQSTSVSLPLRVPSPHDAPVPPPPASVPAGGVPPQAASTSNDRPSSD